MNIEIYLVVVILFAGLMSGYTTRVAARGTFGAELIQKQSWFRLITGTPLLPALLSVAIWGFINLQWYWVIGSFFGISLVGIPVLFGGKNGFSFWYAIQPILDIGVLAGAIYLWFMF